MARKNLEKRLRKRWEGKSEKDARKRIKQLAQQRRAGAGWIGRLAASIPAPDSERTDAIERRRYGTLGPASEVRRIDPGE
jgi:hypothetical protein